MKQAWWSVQVFIGTHFNELIFLGNLVLTFMDVADYISVMR